MLHTTLWTVAAHSTTNWSDAATAASFGASVSCSRMVLSLREIAARRGAMIPEPRPVKPARVRRSRKAAAILALPIPAPAPALVVGGLAVFTDYAGRKIGCRVTRIDAGMAWCKVIGLGEQRPYQNGDIIVRDLCHVQPAI